MFSKKRNRERECESLRGCDKDELLGDLLISIERRFGDRKVIGSAVFIVYENDEQVQRELQRHTESGDPREVIIVNTGITRPMDHEAPPEVLQHWATSKAD